MPQLELPWFQFPVFELPPLPPPHPSVTRAEKLKRYQSFMPTMVAPELKNRREVRREFRRRIPSSVRAAGVDGRVELLLWIDEEGTVQNHEIKKSSGSRDFDMAVQDLVPLLKFRPTTWHGRPVAAVVVLPFTFDVR
jgi:TonB family protein